jgi:sortase A
LSRRRRVSGIVLIAAGLILMMWPVLIGAYGQISQRELARRFANEEAVARQRDAAGAAALDAAASDDDGNSYSQPDGANPADSAESDEAAARSSASSIGTSGSPDVMRDDMSGPLGKLSVPDSAVAAGLTGSGEPIARIRIPRIGLDAIVVEGADGDALRRGPGHLPGSAFPGGFGTCAIAAHRDRWFERLSEVQSGDPVVLETPDYRFAYAVSQKRVVTPDRGDLLAPSADPTLTLITCTGAGYPHSLYRLLVFCRLLRSTPR